jgi:hypothetical protein
MFTEGAKCQSKTLSAREKLLQHSSNRADLLDRNPAPGHRYKKSIDVRHALASIVNFQRDKFICE